MDSKKRVSPADCLPTGENDRDGRLLFGLNNLLLGQHFIEKTKTIMHSSLSSLSLHAWHTLFASRQKETAWKSLWMNG